MRKSGVIALACLIAGIFSVLSLLQLYWALVDALRDVATAQVWPR